MVESILLIICVLVPLFACLVYCVIFQSKKEQEKHDITMKILKKINALLPTKQDKDDKETK